MRPARIAIGMGLGLGLLCILGCQQPSPPKEQIIMPPLEPQVPVVALKAGWSGETIPVPAPVVIPPKTIEEGYAAWARRGYSCNWPVKLEDGRTAVMTAARAQSPDHTLRFIVPQVTVYRPDGTLEMQQTNGPSDHPYPNRPVTWVIYEKDGSTRALEVDCTMVHEPPAICTITCYEHGKMARQYMVHEGIITIEWLMNEKGDLLKPLHMMQH